MIVIESYLKRPSVKINDLLKINTNPEDYFIRIDDKDSIQKIKDCVDINYLEGVLYLEYNDSVLIDFTYWDIIDQLWAYFLNLIEDYIQSEQAETYFPDQPIKLKLSKISKTLVLFSIESQDIIHLTLPKQEFFKSILEAAEVFFATLQDCFKCDSCYSKELGKIDKLKNILG